MGEVRMYVAKQDPVKQTPDPNLRRVSGVGRLFVGYLEKRRACG